MNDNTKKLHELMQQHNLSAPDVARLLDRTPQTVREWRVKNTSRPIPAPMLELLTLKLRARG